MGTPGKESMFGIVLDRPGIQRLARLPRPVPADGEALVRVGFAGMCRSDLELFDGTRPAAYCRYPVTPGHEWSGTIVECKTGADGLKPGQKVVGGGIVFCGHCGNCADGRTNLCLAGYSEIGFTKPGAFAELLVVPVRSLHAVPDEMSLEVAALVEPAACAFHGVSRAQIKKGESVVVIGAGTIGLLAAAFSHLAEPGSLIVISDSPLREAVARGLGVSHFIVAGIETAAQVRELTRGGAHVVIEAAGTPQTVSQSFDLVRPGGRLILEGVIGGDHRLNFATDRWVVNDLAIHGIMGADAASMRGVVEALGRRSMDLAPLIRAVHPLAEFPEALRRLREEHHPAPKLLLNPSLV